MADKKKDKNKKKNIFQRLGAYFREVRLELKKVVWPSLDKLKTTSAVVLIVILFFAVYLAILSEGGQWVLDMVGFYDQVEPTVTETSLAGTEDVVPSGAVAEEVAEEASEEVSEEAAESEENADAETEAAESSEDEAAAE